MQWRTQGVQQVHYRQKSKKFKFLAIFEGFWPITMSLCVANYWYRQLYKVNMSSYKPLHNQEFAEEHPFGYFVTLQSDSYGNSKW